MSLLGQRCKARVPGYGVHEGSVVEELDDGKVLVEFDDGDRKPYSRAAVEKMVAAAAEPEVQAAAAAASSSGAAASSSSGVAASSPSGAEPLSDAELMPPPKCTSAKKNRSTGAARKRPAAAAGGPQPRPTDALPNQGRFCLERGPTEQCSQPEQSLQCADDFLAADGLEDGIDWMKPVEGHPGVGLVTGYLELWPPKMGAKPPADKPWLARFDGRLLINGVADELVGALWTPFLIAAGPGRDHDRAGPGDYKVELPPDAGVASSSGLLTLRHSGFNDKYGAPVYVGRFVLELERTSEACRLNKGLPKREVSAMHFRAYHAPEGMGLHRQPGGRDELIRAQCVRTNRYESGANAESMDED
jgi:hypothetical protein